MVYIQKERLAKKKLTYRARFTIGGCEDWTSWSEFMYLGPNIYIVKWFFYVVWAVSTAFSFFDLEKLNFFFGRPCLQQRVPTW